MSSFGAGCLVSVLLAMSWACAGPQSEAPEQANEPIQVEASSGDLALSLRLDRAKMTGAETLEVTLEAAAPENYQIELPTLDGKVGDFLADAGSTESQRLDADGRVRVTQAYRFEPLKVETATVPELTVLFRRKDDAEAEPEELSTEAVDVEVASVGPALTNSRLPRDIGDPLSVPPPMLRWLAAAATLAILAAIAHAIWRRWRRPQLPPEPPPPLPHEGALQALEDLLGEDLIAQGRAKIFFGRLSEILRRYIELRFGVAAPERTTEEFLSELRTNPDFDPQHKELLADFLRSSDLVKFAEMQPAPDQADESVGACRRFITETKPVEVPEPAGSLE